MARKRRDNTTAADIEVGDLIEPDNNGYRATVTRTATNPSPNIVEPHVSLQWAYPNDFSVNANFRGATSGRYFRPGDSITRWVDSGRATAAGPAKKPLTAPAPEPAPDDAAGLPDVTVDLADHAEEAWNTALTSTRQDVLRSLNSRFTKGGSDALRKRQRYLRGKGPWCTQRDLAELHMLPEALRLSAEKEQGPAIPSEPSSPDGPAGDAHNQISAILPAPTTDEEPPPMATPPTSPDVGNTATEITNLDTAISFSAETAKYTDTVGARLTDLLGQIGQAAGGLAAEAEQYETGKVNLKIKGFGSKITARLGIGAETLNAAAEALHETKETITVAAEHTTTAASEMRASKKVFEEQLGLSEQVGAARSSADVANRTEFYDDVRAAAPGGAGDRPFARH